MVRLSLTAPAVLALVGPVTRMAIGRSIDLTAAVGCVLLVLAWAGFVAWRVTMNAHRKGGLFGDAP